MELKKYFKLHIILPVGFLAIFALTLITVPDASFRDATYAGLLVITAVIITALYVDVVFSLYDSGKPLNMAVACLMLGAIGLVIALYIRAGTRRIGQVTV